MILRVVLSFGTNNARRTFHDLVMIDVGVVTHLYGGAIIVIHLAVNVVITFSLDLDVSS